MSLPVLCRRVELSGVAVGLVRGQRAARAARRPSGRQPGESGRGRVSAPERRRGGLTLFLLQPFTELQLTEEEQKLLSQEGVSLPGNLPLTKVRPLFPPGLPVR